ncbi:MAG: hypothetical protein Q4Q17_05400 [Tissierellia bacterium]|nr:hypothetical protein [Tissierellia bacterium]
MSKNDNVKDLFYNIIDYVVMLTIIIGVVVILGWKFGVLFNKDTNPNADKDNVNLVVENDVNPDESDVVTPDIAEVNEADEQEPGDEAPSDQDNSGTNDNQSDENETNNETNDGEVVNNDPATGEEITVNIPSSALPKQVGEILAEKGLVESAEAFVNKTVELKLDRVLKSGEFVIKKGTSLEAIVKIIARQN